MAARFHGPPAWIESWSVRWYDTGCLASNSNWFSRTEPFLQYKYEHIGNMPSDHCGQGTLSQCQSTEDLPALRASRAGILPPGASPESNSARGSPRRGLRHHSPMPAPLRGALVVGGTQIRTGGWRICNPLPYHLAMPPSSKRIESDGCAVQGIGRPLPAAIDLSRE